VLFAAVALQMHHSSAHEAQTVLHSNKQTAARPTENSSHCYECPDIVAKSAAWLH